MTGQRAISRVWLIGVVVVLIIGVSSIWHILGPTATVTVLSPSQANIRAWVEEQATTELSHDVLVAMPIAGWLEPIDLREGDVVTKGQVVAQLDRADLQDRVHQAEQRIAVLRTRLQRTGDHRLEENALVEAKATVKAIDETVLAAEAKMRATEAIRDFAAHELQRVGKLAEAEAATDRELREAEMQFRKAEAELQSDALELAALKTLAAVSYIGPKFIQDYIDRKQFEAQEIEAQLSEAQADLEIEQRNLERANVVSPIDGVVLHRHNTRRQYLAAGTAAVDCGRPGPDRSGG